jgi:hypothetical protein
MQSCRLNYWDILPFYVGSGNCGRNAFSWRALDLADLDTQYDIFAIRESTCTCLATGKDMLGLLCITTLVWISNLRSPQLKNPELL